MIRYHGYTLFELLLVSSIILIITSIAIPSYCLFMDQHELKNQVNRFITAISYARSLAMNTHKVINFCGSQDHQHCDGAWQTSQLIIDETGRIIRIYNVLPRNYQLIWRSSLGHNNKLQFSFDGFTVARQRGSFYFCPQGHQTSNGIIVVVSASGRLRLDHNKQKLQKYCSES